MNASTLAKQLQYAWYKNYPITVVVQGIVFEMRPNNEHFSIAYPETLPAENRKELDELHSPKSGITVLAHEYGDDVISVGGVDVTVYAGGEASRFRAPTGNGLSLSANNVGAVFVGEMALAAVPA